MIVCYKGEISGNTFVSPDISFIFFKRKNFFYDTGQVFAQFNFKKGAYILLNTIKLETAGIEGRAILPK